MANIPRCESVLGYILTHPDEHDQYVWAEKGPCGTAMCFAGTAVHLSDEYDLIWQMWTCNDKYWSAPLAKRKRDGEIVSVSDAAQDLLDLTDRESNYMFHAANDVDDLERGVKNMANGVDPEDEGDEVYDDDYEIDDAA